MLEEFGMLLNPDSMKKQVGGVARNVLSVTTYSLFGLCQLSHSDP